LQSNSFDVGPILVPIARSLAATHHRHQNKTSPRPADSRRPVQTFTASCEHYLCLGFFRSRHQHAPPRPYHRARHHAPTPATTQHRSTHTYRLPIVKEQAGSPRTGKPPAERRDYTTKTDPVNTPCDVATQVSARQAGGNRANCRLRDNKAEKPAQT